MLTVFEVLGGLALFMFGMAQMTRGLQGSVESQLRRLITQATSNRVQGLALGTGLGFLVHSSAATVMYVGFANAGLVGLVQAVPPIMGANLGTTLSMQMVSLKLTDYCMVAVAIGFLCVGVLNLNNLRDVVSDKKHGKITMVVKMGFDNGKRYHSFLILMALVCFVLFLWLENFGWKASFFMLAFVPLLIHLRKVMLTQNPGDLDAELKKVALSTFLLALLFLISVNIFL